MKGAVHQVMADWQGLSGFSLHVNHCHFSKVQGAALPMWATSLDSGPARELSYPGSLLACTCRPATSMTTHRDLTITLQTTELFRYHPLQRRVSEEDMKGGRGRGGGRVQAYLRAELSGKNEDRHEGYLAQHRQHQGVPQHKQLIAQAQLFVHTCTMGSCSQPSKWRGLNLIQLHRLQRYQAVLPGDAPCPSRNEGR